MKTSDCSCRCSLSPFKRRWTPMFLCSPCHKQGGCKSFMEMQSHGRCENCGNTDHCVDCHHYNFSGRTEAEIEADVEKALAGVKCRYFVTEHGKEEREVTKEMYVNVERSAGFH